MGRPVVPESLWSQSLVPLEPDRCFTEGLAAPCAYLHLKQRALAGVRLPDHVRAFVGVDVPDSRPRERGWRLASSVLNALQEQPSHWDVPDEDRAMLQALIDVDVPNRPQLAFLSG